MPYAILSTTGSVALDRAMLECVEDVLCVRPTEIVERWFKLEEVAYKVPYEHPYEEDALAAIGKAYGLEFIYTVAEGIISMRDIHEEGRLHVTCAAWYATYKEEALEADWHMYFPDTGEFYISGSLE